MFLSVFGVRVQLFLSTSPTPGKLAASIQEADNSVRPDLFIWDPVSSVVQFDEDRLHELLRDAKRAEPGWASVLLWATDFAISVVKGLRNVFGGSYGGSLGFGGVGSVVAIASTILLLIATIAAAVIVLPLSLVAWGLRMKINSEITAERQKVLDQVIEFFHQAQRGPEVTGGAVQTK